MMTITAHEFCRSPKESLANLQRGWGELTDDSARWIRYKGQWHYVEGLYNMLRAYSPDSPFDYVRVYEPHADGAIHAHFLTNYHPVDFREPRPEVLITNPQTGSVFKREKVPEHGSRFLKNAARSCGMGHQTDIKILHGHAGLAAAYVTKYLMKSVEDSASKLPKGTARIITSRGFKEPTDSNPSDYEWTITQGFTIEHARRLWAQGYGIHDQDLKHRVSVDDFAHFEYSPYIPIDNIPKQD